MPVQVLDYSLTNFKVPGLSQYTPPFGTKKADGAGLTTTEITRNEMMPFLKQRSINGASLIAGNDPSMGVITQDSIAQPIEFDATFAVGEGVTLQLADPSYEGQKIVVVASFSEGVPATVILGVAGTPEELELAADAAYMFLAVNGKWKTFSGGGSGRKEVTNVANASSYNPGTGAGGISWSDPTVPFDHIEIEDLLNPGTPVNVAPGVQKFAPATGNHNYVIRTIDSLGNSLAAVEVGVTSYTIVYLADIESITIPLLAPNQIIIAFDNFVSCSSAAGFSIEGITDGLAFVNQPDGRSVKLQLSSKVFAAASVYTLSYTGAGSLKQADNSNVAAWSNAAVVNNSNYALASFVSAEIPQGLSSTLVLGMSRAVKDIDASKFTLSGTTANVLSVVSPTAGNSSTTIEFLLDEPVNADESTIRLSMAAGGMSDDVNQAVPPFSNQQGSNNSSHTAIGGASSAQVPTSAPNTIQVVMEGAVRINNTTSDSGVPTGWSLSMPDQSPSPTISSWQISDGTITFTLSESILVNKTVSIAYDGTDSTFKAVLNGDGVPAFNITVVNNSTDLGGVPPGVTPRNLAMILLGHEVTGAEDVTTIVNLIHNTIQRGSINNLVIGDRLVITSV